MINYNIEHYAQIVQKEGMERIANSHVTVWNKLAISSTAFVTAENARLVGTEATVSCRVMMDFTVITAIRNAENA